MLSYHAFAGIGESPLRCLFARVVRNLVETTCERGILAKMDNAKHGSFYQAPNLISILVFDYQSERHCTKTHPCASPAPSSFDYQSERHCTKTRPVVGYEGY